MTTRSNWMPRSSGRGQNWRRGRQRGGEHQHLQRGALLPCCLTFAVCACSLSMGLASSVAGLHCSFSFVRPTLRAQVGRLLRMRLPAGRWRLQPCQPGEARAVAVSAEHDSPLPNASRLSSKYVIAGRPDPLHPRQLVVQAHLRDVARHAQCAQVRLHGAAQVVRREADAPLKRRCATSGRWPRAACPLFRWASPPCRAARLRECAGSTWAELPASVRSSRNQSTTTGASGMSIAAPRLALREVPLRAVQVHVGPLGLGRARRCARPWLAGCGWRGVATAHGRGQQQLQFLARQHQALAARGRSPSSAESMMPWQG